MKRILHILTALVLCLTMTGCTGAGQDNAASQTSAQMLTSYNTCFADGGKASYLLLDGTAYGLGFAGRKLMRFDKDAKTMAPLCNADGCIHINDSCATYLPDSTDAVSVGYCDGQIYLFAENAAEKNRQGNPERYLYRYDEETLEKTVTKLEYAGNLYFPVFKNENYIYYLYQQFSADKGMQNCLVKADIDTGAGRVVLAASPNYSLNIAGLDGDNIVLVEYNNYSANNYTSSMFFYNMNSGNIIVHEDFPFRSERICTPVGQVFTFDYNSKILYTYENRNKREVLKMQGALAGYSILNIYGMYNDIVIVECSADNGTGTKLAVNTKTGEYHEVVSKYKEYELDDYFTQVRPLGCTGDGFIVINGRSFYDITATEKPSHGQAFQKVNHLAYISADDFLNSRRDYIQLNKQEF